MIFFCLVRVACQTVSVFYFPTTEVATCSPRLPIFHSDAYFREVIKVIEKLQDVCLTFFNKYNSSATLAQSWKRELTDSVHKCQTFRFLTILTCLMILTETACQCPFIVFGILPLHLSSLVLPGSVVHCHWL